MANAQNKEWQGERDRRRLDKPMFKKGVSMENPAVIKSSHLLNPFAPFKHQDPASLYPVEPPDFELDPQPFSENSAAPGIKTDLPEYY